MPYSDDFQNWSSTSPLPCWDIDNGTQTVMLYTDAASNNSMPAGQFLVMDGRQHGNQDFTSGEHFERGYGQL